MATFTIANGASLSDAISLAGALPAAIVMPASWTAANLTFQASLDGTTYNNVYDDAGTEVTVTAAASRFILFANISQFFGIGMQVYLKIRSGTSGTPVNQGAARSIALVGVQ